jgi:hypothetical protein
MEIKDIVAYIKLDSTTLEDAVESIERLVTKCITKYNEPMNKLSTLSKNYYYVRRENSNYVLGVLVTEVGEDIMKPLINLYLQDSATTVADREIESLSRWLLE